MEKTMKIEGMMCPHCEARVKKTLEAMDGVAGAVVSHTAGTAIVTLSAPIDNETLKKAIEDQGYPVLGIE
ncbi:MAG: heavy-metal-associated domain-containing protein [Clostridia bacterium]|nr:heavy-metal-associated domain-containing protein [Clostridia bacterium]